MLKRLIGFVLVGATMSTSMLININSTIPHIARDTKGISSTYSREERVKQFEKLTNKYIEEKEKLRLEEERRIEEERIRLEEERVANEIKVEWTNYQLTFYCSCQQCSGEWGSSTASGMELIPYMTCASDGSYPFGTKIYIDGFGELTVVDRGGGVHGNILDVFVGNDHNRALELGRKNVRGCILE